MEKNHYGPAAGSGFIAYVRDTSGPNQLFYWDTAVATEGIITTNAEHIDEWNFRADGHMLVWVDSSNGEVLYTFVNQADLSILPEDIIPSRYDPTDTDAIDVAVCVHNVSSESTTNNITVKLYAGNPYQGGTQIGPDQVISGGIAGHTNAEAVFVGMTFSEGSNSLYAVCSLPDADYPSNNVACIGLSVGDADRSPPAISDIEIVEHGGDGDGYIEDNEEVRVSWTLSDDTGIGETACQIDGQSNTVSGTYYCDCGPLASGVHTAEIAAVDSDYSPEAMSARATTFEVYPNGPAVIDVSPTNLDIDVARNTSVCVMFDEALDSDSITNGVLVMNGAEPVDGILSYDSVSGCISFTPSELLEFGRTYTCYLLSGQAGVKDETGNCLTADYSWVFTTVSDVEAPTAAISSLECASGIMTIVGTANDEEFLQYVLEYGDGTNPVVWADVCTASNAVSFGSLGEWDTRGFDDESVYSLRLQVEDKSGHISTNTCRGIVILDEDVDHDWDGVASGDETIAGTCPTNADALFTIDEYVLSSSTNCSMSWQSVLGRRYTIYRCMKMSSTSKWVNVLSILGDGNQKDYEIDTRYNDSQFLRLGVKVLE